MKEKSFLAEMKKTFLIILKGFYFPEIASDLKTNNIISYTLTKIFF